MRTDGGPRQQTESRLRRFFEVLLGSLRADGVDGLWVTARGQKSPPNRDPKSGNPPDWFVKIYNDYTESVRNGGPR